MTHGIPFQSIPDPVVKLKALHLRGSGWRAAHRNGDNFPANLFPAWGWTIGDVNTAGEPRNCNYNAQSQVTSMQAIENILHGHVLIGSKFGSLMSTLRDANEQAAGWCQRHEGTFLCPQQWLKMVAPSYHECVKTPQHNNRKPKPDPWATTSTTKTVYSLQMWPSVDMP